MTDLPIPDELKREGAIAILARWSLWAAANNVPALGENLLYMSGGKLSVEVVMEIAEQVAPLATRPPTSAVRAAKEILMEGG